MIDSSWWLRCWPLGAAWSIVFSAVVLGRVERLRLGLHGKVALQ
jgi:hypothetical protein